MHWSAVTSLNTSLTFSSYFLLDSSQVIVFLLFLCNQSRVCLSSSSLHHGLKQLILISTDEGQDKSQYFFPASIHVITHNFICMHGSLVLFSTSGENFKSIASLEIYLSLLCSILICMHVYEPVFWPCVECRVGRSAGSAAELFQCSPAEGRAQCPETTTAEASLWDWTRNSWHRHTHTHTHTQRHRHRDTHTHTQTHAHTHTHTDTDTHTHTHTQRHTHTHTHTHRHTHTHTHTQTQTHTHTHTHTETQTHTHTHTHTDTRTHTHTHRHRRRHTHTHTHTHTLQTHRYRYRRSSNNPSAAGYQSRVKLVGVAVSVCENCSRWDTRRDRDSPPWNTHTLTSTTTHCESVCVCVWVCVPSAAVAVCVCRSPQTLSAPALQSRLRRPSSSPATSEAHRMPTTRETLPTCTLHHSVFLKNSQIQTQNIIQSCYN